jgi:hypothetical protein
MSDNFEDPFQNGSVEIIGNTDPDENPENSLHTELPRDSCERNVELPRNSNCVGTQVSYSGNVQPSSKYCRQGTETATASNVTTHTSFLRSCRGSSSPVRNPKCVVLPVSSQQGTEIASNVTTHTSLLRSCRGSSSPMEAIAPVLAPFPTNAVLDQCWSWSWNENDAKRLIITKSTNGAKHVCGPDERTTTRRTDCFFLGTSLKDLVWFLITLMSVAFVTH